MLKHLTRRIRRHWPRSRLTVRGDSHYGRPEAMGWRVRRHVPDRQGDLRGQRGRAPRR